MQLEERPLSPADAFIGRVGGNPCAPAPTIVAAFRPRFSFSESSAISRAIMQAQLAATCGWSAPRSAVLQKPHERPLPAPAMVDRASLSAGPRSQPALAKRSRSPISRGVRLTAQRFARSSRWRATAIRVVRRCWRDAVVYLLAEGAQFHAVLDTPRATTVSQAMATMFDEYRAAHAPAGDWLIARLRAILAKQRR